MPIIRINSLPLPDKLDMKQVMEALSSGISRDVRIEQAQLSLSWQITAANHYIAKGELAETQPSHSHPILVELLMPEILSKSLSEKIMHSLAHRLGKELNFPVTNIFIYERQLASQQVFEKGMIANWSE
ncbi:MAG: hypothetical protein JKY50_11365 [Oleispira sp.]|nr:hypothetical protein [Oleispira sp.]MBL4882465.1 hypothetical protein [Oleispira sp.]